MNNLKFILSTLLIISAMFFGCQKDDSLTEITNEASEPFEQKSQQLNYNNLTIADVPIIETFDKMLYFKDNKQYEKITTILANSNETELDNWEKQMDFVSLRSIQNQIYDKLENVKSEDEIRSFLAKYDKVFELYLNEENEQEIRPIIDGLVLPILINENGFFRVGNTVSKVTSDYLISADISNYEMLKNITNKEAATIENNEIFSVKKHTVKSYRSCGYGSNASVTSGKRRVKIWFIVENNGSGNIYRYDSGIKVRGYKKVLGIWYWYKTNLTLYASEYTVTYPSSYSNGWIYNEKDISVAHQSRETTVIRVTKLLSSFYYNGSSTPSYYFNSYDGRASSRGVGNNIVRLTCGQ